MSALASLLTRHLSIPSQSESENTLRLLIRMGLMVTSADEGSLLVLDDEAGDLVFAMTVGDPNSEATLRGQRVPLGEGITGLAAATLEVQIGAPKFKDVQQWQQSDAQGGGPQVVIAAPMLVDERLVGVITAVSFDRTRRFTTQDGKIFGGFAAIAGVVISQAQRLAGLALPAADGPATALEGRHRIARSVARIVEARPEAIDELASILSGIERLIVGR